MFVKPFYLRTRSLPPPAAHGFVSRPKLILAVTQVTSALQAFVIELAVDKGMALITKE
jgi:hypothetical protein